MLSQALRRCLLGDYAFYRIFATDPRHTTPAATGELTLERITEPDILSQAGDPAIQRLRPYAGRDAVGFTARLEDRIVAACFFWYARRYQRERDFWPLQPGEAKLVEVRTDRTHRNRGVAGKLIRFATCDMAVQGFTRLYARIWHSNEPSVRAFMKAGWREIANVAEFEPLSLGKRVHQVTPVVEPVP